MTKPTDPGTDPTLITDRDPGSAPTEAPGLSGAQSAMPASGYTVGELLGRGGMGEVLLARDRRIGRDVAIKRMRSPSPSADAVARFLREARIQGRLDHPAVVPVHELGYDDEGRPFFTMKRLAGTTLMDVISTNAVPQQQLLRNFIDVCLAVEFAHSRGVVHRDLKPANIMLGDFGEVYVLDWGVARVNDEEAPDDEPGVPSLDGETQAGALLGTPGYMSPELIRGEAVDQRADVYALGCIMFEILAREPLHPRNDTLASSISHPSGSPGAHAKLDVAPELEAACLAALAAHPAERPTARELAGHIQRYIDGDRDLERRRSLAAEELVRATTALAAGDRATAMQSAGRALALDPESQTAARLVTSLLLEPPRELPAELHHHLGEIDRDMSRKQWRLASVAFAAFLPFAPMILLQGVVSMPLFGALVALIVVAIVFSELNHRRLYRNVVPIALVINVLVCMLFTRMAGPFMLVPGILAVLSMSWMSYPSVIERPWPVAIGMLAALAVPLVLEGTGLVSRMWSVEGDAVVTRSAMIAWQGPLSAVLLISASVAIVGVALVIARGLALTRREALRKVEIQAWHLRKLLPVER